MQNSEEVKTVIGEDVEIVGSVKSASNVKIDGKLNGDLTCKGNAVIGPSANVKGNLNVNSIEIHGHVSGNVNARDRIQLKATANLNGDIRGKRLSVEDGVTFIGKSEVNPQGPSQRGPGQEAAPGGAEAESAEPVVEDKADVRRAGMLGRK
ncbi:MAG: polymer-forming cytoskeletal protein [Lentisphaerae bacterium]|nr:polymer-forming cytoskeletal protein [Lentisphaerota bacterium]